LLRPPQEQGKGGKKRKKEKSKENYNQFRGEGKVEGRVSQGAERRD